MGVFDNIRKDQIIDLIRFVYREGVFHEAVAGHKPKIDPDNMTDQQCEELYFEFMGLRLCDCWLGNMYCKCEPNE